MMVVSPVRSDERVNLHRHNLCEVMKSIGTGTYGKSCLGFLENSLNVDQWALFRFRSGIPIGDTPPQPAMVASLAAAGVQMFDLHWPRMLEIMAAVRSAVDIAVCPPEP